MFSLQIVDTDAFLDMPQSSQLLYFHLCMRADDEGFVGNPKKVIRMIGASEDDYKILVAKRFVLLFESAVMVIKHWLIHNTIRMDRFGETVYREEKALLSVKENKAYTMATTWQPNGNHLATQVKLSKDKLSKDRLTSIATEVAEPVNEFISFFKEINPSYETLYSNRSQRAAASRLLKKFGLEAMKKTIQTIEKTNGMQYAPSITTPLELERNGGRLKAFLTKHQKDSLKNNIVEI